MSKGDVLVIKVPYFLSKSKMQQFYKSFVEQKNLGVVLLPAGFEAAVVPSDVKIVVEDANKEEGFTEDDC